MIKKVKDWLGIEGVKIQLSMPETFTLSNNRIEGSYTISSQSDQYIESVHLVLKEKYFRGRRKSKLIDEYILAEAVYPIDQAIDRESILQKDFELQFESIKSPIDKFGDKNFLYQGITILAKLIKNAKSQYSLTIEVKVKGNRLKPYDKANLVAQ